MSKPFKPPSPGSDPLLRELQEEVRRERYAKLWEKYGVYALALAALIVVGVGAYQFWQGRRIAAAERAGETYENAVAALDGGESEGAIKTLEELARKGPSGYSALSRLQVAGAYVKAGRTAEAVTVYQAISSDSRVDPVLRDYARLQAAAARAGDADWTEMQNRLNDLVAGEGPWRNAARELWAFAALKAGKTAEARDAFTQLAGDKATPPDMRERAETALSSLVSVAPAAAPATPPAETGAATKQ